MSSSDTIRFFLVLLPLFNFIAACEEPAENDKRSQPTSEKQDEIDIAGTDVADVNDNNGEGNTIGSGESGDGSTDEGGSATGNSNDVSAGFSLVQKWRTATPENQQSTVAKIAFGPEGEIYATGPYNQPEASDPHWWLMRLSDKGSSKWSVDSINAKGNTTARNFFVGVGGDRVMITYAEWGSGLMNFRTIIRDRNGTLHGAFALTGLEPGKSPRMRSMAVTPAGLAYILGTVDEGTGRIPRMVTLSATGTIDWSESKSVTFEASQTDLGVRSSYLLDRKYSRIIALAAGSAGFAAKSLPGDPTSISLSGPVTSTYSTDPEFWYGDSGSIYAIGSESTGTPSQLVTHVEKLYPQAWKVSLPGGNWDFTAHHKDLCTAGSFTYVVRSTLSQGIYAAKLTKLRSDNGEVIKEIDLDVVAGSILCSDKGVVVGAAGYVIGYE